MGMNEYVDAAESFRHNPETFRFLGGCSDSLITLAQDTLGVMFPNTYFEYLSEFGASHDVYGVIDDTFEPRFRPDAIGITLRLRAESALPHDLVVISDVGDGEVLCLATSAIKMDDCPVVGFLPGLPVEEQPLEQVENSFGAFIHKVAMRKLRRSS